MSKEHKIFLLCANMDGSDKVKPFVIGKFANPWTFRAVCSIPATYKANKKVWMTSKLFKQWLHAFDVKVG
jgi:hypothetical protein